MTFVQCRNQLVRSLSAALPTACMRCELGKFPDVSGDTCCWQIALAGLSNADPKGEQGPYVHESSSALPNKAANDSRYSMTLCQNCSVEEQTGNKHN